VLPGLIPRIVVDGVDVTPALVALTIITVGVAFALGLARGRGVRYALWAGLLVTLLVIGAVTLGSVLTDHGTGAQGVNLVPFQEIQRGLDHRGTVAWTNLVGNVILFIPLGLAVAGLVRGGFWFRLISALAAGLVLSTAIEITQYTGGRVADIDDIILNGAGALLGGLVGATLGGIAEHRSRRADRTTDQPPPA